MAIGFLKKRSTTRRPSFLDYSDVTRDDRRRMGDSCDSSLAWSVFRCISIGVWDFDTWLDSALVFGR